jgi:hypothetical protein
MLGPYDSQFERSNKTALRSNKVNARAVGFRHPNNIHNVHRTRVYYCLPWGLATRRRSVIPRCATVTYRTAKLSPYSYTRASIGEQVAPTSFHDSNTPTCESKQGKTWSVVR